MNLSKTIFVNLCLFSISLLILQSELLGQGKKLFKASEISKNELLPKGALNFRISFLDQAKPISKGWWPFSKDKMWIEIFIRNELDSTIYIEPPYSIHGDQTMSFQIKQGKNMFLPKNIPVIKDTVPLKFLKIEPSSVYRDTINVLAEDNYDFKKGETYEISAFYYSQWAAFIDENGQKHPVWSGRIQSNSLKFKYPK